MQGQGANSRSAFVGCVWPAGWSCFPMSRFIIPTTHWGISPSRRWKEGWRCRRLVWQSPPGAILLYGALLTHLGLGFWALYERRQFRWTRMEATQLALGLTIPFLLADHVFGTRVSLSLFGTDKGYAQELYKFSASPPSGLLQAVLLLIVWISRLHRGSLLAGAQALLSEGEEPPAFRSRAPADAGAPRLRPRPAGDSPRRHGPGLAGAEPVARSISERRRTTSGSWPTAGIR